MHINSDNKRSIFSFAYNLVIVWEKEEKTKSEYN